MFATLPIVLPVFALVLAGWAARRLGVLGPRATAELNRFVVTLALPALLFDIVANAHPSELWQPGFIAAFGGGCLAMFGGTVAIRLRGGRPLADATLDGLCTGYANTGYMGFPLTLVALGPASRTPTLLAAIMTVCALFAIAIALIETALQAETGRTRLATAVVRSLGRNPLLVAPALGALVPLAGLSVPAPAETFLKLLGGAASPTALVALGLFLATKRPASEGQAGVTALFVALKLVAHPLVTWLLAAALHLPPPATGAAVLLAALPTGTGPFMLAEHYGREAGVTGRVILASTVLSLATLSLCLALIAPGR